MPLNTRALSSKFGVAITGTDLSEELDEKLFNEIVDVFVKKQVLVFRDQHIEPQHQVASAGGLAHRKPAVIACFRLREFAWFVNLFSVRSSLFSCRSARLR